MLARRVRPIACPKCRALGSTTDCSERIKHAQDGKHTASPVNDSYDSEPDLIVTLTFAIACDDVEDEDGLRDRATRLRDQWLSEPEDLIDVIRDYGDDYDLQVKLLSEP